MGEPTTAKQISEVRSRRKEPWPRAQKSAPKCVAQEQDSFGLAVSLLFMAATALKFVIFSKFVYRSDDFEVHRNWMALTWHLPIERWYYNTTSRWTLDYPPAFAYFSWLLAKIATLVIADRSVLDATLRQVPDSRLRGIKYHIDTKLFMARSVAISDVLLAIGTYLCLRPLKHQIASRARIKLLAASIILNPGLLVVDHIHFQYNGALLGLLLISIGVLRQNSQALCGARRVAISAALFTLLVLSKHLFVVLAPAFAFYILAQTHARLKQCDRTATALSFLAAAAAAVLATAGPILWPFRAHFSQLLTRLFPFSRGLLHTQWAPNFWALYVASDRLLARALHRLPAKTLAVALSHLPPALAARVRASRNIDFKWGQHGPTRMAILPEITPVQCLVLVAAFSLPGLIALRRCVTAPRSTATQAFEYFVRALVCCGCAAVLFGWHVHEKALMTVTILLPVLLAQTEYAGGTSSDLVGAYFAHAVSAFVAINYLLVAASPVEAVLVGLVALVLVPALLAILYMPRDQLLATSLIMATCVADACRVTAISMIGQRAAIWQAVSALFATGAVLLTWSRSVGS